MTIDSIGRDKFEKALQEHRHLMDLVSLKCWDRALFPCSKDGVKQKGNCYWKDSGCGFKCLDELYFNYSKGLI